MLLPGLSRADRVEQFLTRVVLEDVAQGTQAQSPLGHRPIVVHRQDTMRACGCLSRMMRAAARPSSPGILMSLNITSGDSDSTAATRLCPSLTVAKKLLDDAMAVDDAEAKLKASYVPKILAALPATKTARYIQIEHKIRAAIRYELAAGIPLVD